MFSKSETIELTSPEGKFLTKSWLEAQKYCLSHFITHFSLLDNRRRICDWPSGKNYYFCKKAVCFPGKSAIEYRCVGYLQGGMLVKLLYKLPEYRLVEKTVVALDEKDKDFLLYVPK